MAVSAAYGSLPFSEQIAFFQRKLNMSTDSYADVFGSEHDWAFVVAGANRDEMVADFRAAIEKAIEGGTTIEEFRQDFDAIVEKYGWDYKGGRSWRTRIIFDTNIRSSYMAGRYQQLYALREVLEYWEYTHSDAVEHPRELHESWDGLILRWDDPWWDYYFPINAYGCQCGVIGRSADDLKRMGKTPGTAPAIEFEQRIIGKNSPLGPRVVNVPKGLDPGFDHIPGKSRLSSQVPPPQNDSPLTDELTTIPQSVASQIEPLAVSQELSADKILPPGLTQTDYASRFLSEFGAAIDSPLIFKDVLGEPIVIGSELFISRKTGQIEISQHGREKYLLLLAEALKSPAEIWINTEWTSTTQQAAVRRRYIARFNIEGVTYPMLAVFEVGTNGWRGITAVVPESSDYLSVLRQGTKLYPRGD